MMSDRATQRLYGESRTTIIVFGIVLINSLLQQVQLYILRAKILAKCPALCKHRRQKKKRDEGEEKGD